MITGPELMERSGLDRLDLVKIDVEGHEEPVLRSLQPILARWRPRAVVFEHDGNPDEPGSAVGSVFRDLDYRVLGIRKRLTRYELAAGRVDPRGRRASSRLCGGAARAHGRAVSGPRVLLVAEVADPDGASVPLVGWSHARAIARVTDAHLVTQIRSRDAILRAGLREGREFSVIDSERTRQARLEVHRACSRRKRQGLDDRDGHRRTHELVLRAAGLEAFRGADPRARVRPRSPPDSAESDDAQSAGAPLRARRHALRARPAERRRPVAERLRLRAPAREGVAQLRARPLPTRARAIAARGTAPPRSSSALATRWRRWAPPGARSACTSRRTATSPARFAAAPRATSDASAARGVRGPARAVQGRRHAVGRRGAAGARRAARGSTSSATARRCRR